MTLPSGGGVVPDGKIRTVSIFLPSDTTHLEFVSYVKMCRMSIALFRVNRPLASQWYEPVEGTSFRRS
jgi:hypothetical protein